MPMSEDPYAAPQSAVSDVDADARPGRPLLVWIITVFFGLSAVWTLVSFALILSGAVPLPPAAREYYARLGILDYALTIGVSALNLWGIVLLFLLRARAVKVILAALAVTLLINAYQVLLKGLAPALGGAGSMGMVIGPSLWAAILFYAWRLKAKGVLR
jgi:hypothetical protein